VPELEKGAGLAGCPSYGRRPSLEYELEAIPALTSSHCLEFELEGAATGVGAAAGVIAKASHMAA
jgi:hypothetical protein